MDNAIADRLASLLAHAGLRAITVTAQHGVARRGDRLFDPRVTIWAEVAATRGRQMVADGAIGERARAEAEADWRAWARDTAETQTLYLLAVEGIRA